MFNQTDIIIPLAISGPAILACGAWLKNTVCLTQENNAYISPLIGDLATANTRQLLDQTVYRMCKNYSIQPELVAHDLHPDFYSTHFAQTFAEQQQLPLLAVQHHHAHIGAICAEHQLTQSVIALALDGVGLGIDNAPWGGELLMVDGARSERLGHLTTLALPGGDLAAQEPWRMAAAALARLNRSEDITQRFADQPAAATVTDMLTKSLNCPQTSSMGRLFDAAAGLLGVCLTQSYEAQAALQLERLAAQHGSVLAMTNGYQITEKNNLDFSPLLMTLIDDHDLKQNLPYAAALFHATLIEGLVTWVKIIAEKLQVFNLAFGGGCFHNTVLRHGLIKQLTTPDFNLFFSQQLQPDDSAIALGQAWVALQNAHS